MCGIAGGVWWDTALEISPQIQRRMTNSIRHRGPDADGQWRTESVGEICADSPAASLGHRRLSIIDVDGSAQPLANEDQTVWISFNGEIYNYRELRQQLIARGHQFRTEGDTEVIVHLYEEYGTDFAVHLRGMFALAIWDQNHRRLVLARDRAGKKPLYYRMEKGRLCFGSELKALLQVPGISRELDHTAVLSFLTLQYVPHPHCILKGYSKLPPASIAVLQSGQLDVSTYWTPPYAEPDLGRRSVADWQEELQATLHEAVRLRLRSDVPLGAFLSGGIDSTIVCGLMQEQLDAPVRTFSMGFPISSFDERGYAREAAEHLGTMHHDDQITPDALGILPSLVWHYDEPFGDSSAIPTMHLSRMVRERVTVALTGDGGDELFCGYDRYRAARATGLLDGVPRVFRQWVSRAVSLIPASVEQRSFRRRLKRLFEALAQDPERRYLNWITIFNSAKLEWLISPELRPLLQQQDPAAVIAESYQRYPQRDFLTRTTAVDVHSYLPCDILTKVDIASMAASLECRCPLLDQEVMELAARMPLEVKQTATQSKKVLTDTFARFLPETLRKRRKMGFGVPIDHWFRGELQPLLRDILLSDRCLSRGLLRPEAVEVLVDEHTSGAVNHAYRLWSLLCLEIWQRMYLDQEVPEAAPSTLPR